MINRESPIYQKYVKKFFAEIMQTSGHYPPLKARLREHFNRFELEDLSELFAQLCWEIIDKAPVLEDVISDDEHEKPEEDPQQSGEEGSPVVPDQTPGPSDESVGCDVGGDPSESA